MSQKVSIVKLAEAAGVSKATVSRVLNEYPRVSPQVAEAVRRVARELGYERPKSCVGRPRRAPAGIQRGSIALVFPDTDPSSLRTVLSGRLLHGIEEVLRQRRISLQLSGLPEVDRLPLCVEQRQVDGIVVRGRPSDAIIQALGRLPCVTIFETTTSLPGNWDIVLEDNDAIAALAAEYLTERNRKRVAVINRWPEHPSLRHRIRTFKAIADDVGLQVRVLNEAQDIARLVDQLLAEGPIDGLFLPGSDQDMVDVYRGLAARGVRPVDDLDVIGVCHDAARISTLDPRLANIDIQPEAIGRAAVNMLLSRLQNPREPQRRLAIGPLLVEPALAHV